MLKILLMNSLPSMNLLVYLDSLYSVRALLWQVVHFL